MGPIVNPDAQDRNAATTAASSSTDYADLLAQLTQTNGQFVTLPDGRYVLIDPKTGRVIQDYGVKGQGGGAAASGAATQGQLLSNQIDQAQLAENQRQFNEQFGMDKARGDQQQQLAQQLGLGNLDVSRGNLAVNQGQLSLQQAQQAYKQYSDLAALASNPRNFVQSFFMNRGVTPPSDVARYGNTTQTAANIMPFSQFLQSQGGGVGGYTPPQGAAPMANQYGSTQNNPMNPYAGTNVNYGGSKTTADTAMINGVQTWAGGPYSGRSVASSPANAGDLTPYLQNPGLAAPAGSGPNMTAPNPGQAMPTSMGASPYAAQLGAIAQTPGVQLSDWAVKQMNPPRQFARGGTLHMTGPHAVVDLITGKVRAIAGEAGPENAHFDGAALIDPYANDYSGTIPGQGDPFATDPYAPTTPTAPTSDPYITGPTLTSGLPDTQGLASTPQTIDYSAIGALLAAQANATNPNLNPTTTTTPQTPYVAPYVAPQTPYVAPSTVPTGTNFLGGDPIADPIRTGVIQAQAVPQTAYSQYQQTVGGGGNVLGGQTGTVPPPPTATNPQNAYTPGDPNAPTFGQPIPNRMPTYLGGENFQGASSVLAGMQASGAVPPFLSRSFAQARGDASQGTNVPQRNDLPPDLPLMSRLAYEQLNPSEQQAMLSYASALGVTPEDYLAMIYGGGPQGPQSQLPTFGSPLRWNGQ